ncbi:hypothetical protein ACHAWF_018462 [Thalassiosira exigua]
MKEPTNGFESKSTLISGVTTNGSRRRSRLRSHGVNSYGPPLRDRHSLLLLLCAISKAPFTTSFSMSWGIRCNGFSPCQHAPTPLLSAASPVSEDPAVASSLSNLYPKFADILRFNGYITPTPIQQSSAFPAKEGEDLLLIAATGSGKTLAYLLPVLSQACDDVKSQMQRRTVLIVAPTRELASQLARDASLLLPEETSNDDEEMIMQNVLLAVRGFPPPTPSQLSHATVLIGTPNELYAVLTRMSRAQNFLSALTGTILDEVDVLLPPAPKNLRTTFDGNIAQRERKTLEQRRKLRAAQRRGVEFHGGASIRGKSIDSLDLSNAKNSQVLTPTERVLRLIASAQHVSGEDDRLPLQVLAGSATASRATLDRLNKALRWAALEGGVIGSDGLEGVWRGRMKVCRPAGGDNNLPNGPKQDISSETNAVNDSTHTIRAVTVPSVVDHRYLHVSKETISNSHEILAMVAGVIRKLQPKSSLVFICGEFSRSISKEKKREGPQVSGKTSQARRNAKRRSVFIERQKSNEKKGPTGPEPLSVRKACSTLQSMGVDAQPMHVVLGLEPNAEHVDDEKIDEVDLPPVMVTFEGSARGLHFDGVDIVFVVGRPTSAASYLHLAGRVGRAMSSSDTDESEGEVEVRPGTIVSFCSKGRAAELEKWTGQVGATGLEEIVL